MNPWRVQRQHKIILHNEPVRVETACAHASRWHAHFSPPTDGAMANLGLAQCTFCELGAAATAGRGKFSNHNDACFTRIRISPDAPHQAHAYGAVSEIRSRGTRITQG